MQRASAGSTANPVASRAPTSALSMNIRAASISSSTTAVFTWPVYNVTVEENALGKDVYAISNEPVRMGVPLPTDDSVVKFKIVEGDKQSFKAEAKIVGDFAFLRIRHRNDGTLNRELKVCSCYLQNRSGTVAWC
ncbi:unnamed protein product [Gongylonema pulchrum]|uniref:Cadherin domain-containing protein n=1 Tax=Gongylonema pulchrum TaxID=637853 RepID=A0A183EHX2_9BILA|nr:unnamed protein product [Gongylonema pulchrum]